MWPQSSSGGGGLVAGPLTKELYFLGIPLAAYSLAYLRTLWFIETAELFNFFLSNASLGSGYHWTEKLLNACMPKKCIKKAQAIYRCCGAGYTVP